MTDPRPTTKRECEIAAAVLTAAVHLVDDDAAAETLAGLVRQWEDEGDAAPQSIWDDVKAERARAHAKHGDKSMEASSWLTMRRLRILLEEVGEVAKEFNDAEIEDRPVDPTRLRRELVQVSAMAGAWADAVPGDAPASSNEECSTCNGSGLVDWEPFANRDSEEDQQPCPDCATGREHAAWIGRRTR